MPLTSNPYLLILFIGIFYILVVGGFSLLRGEGLSAQFALEVLLLTGFVLLGMYLTNSDVNPILFLTFIYIISMRSRLMTSLAVLLSNRGRQKNAIDALQVALQLFPDGPTRSIILLNMGIVQIRRQNPESAIQLLEMVLDEKISSTIGMRFKAACLYNLGIAYQKKGNKAKAVTYFNKVIDEYPSTVFAQRAEKALKKK